jgi:hypothetical protein
MQILKIWKRTDERTSKFSSPLIDILLLGGIALGISAGTMSAPAQSVNPPFSSGWNSATSSAGEISVLGTIRQVESGRAGGPAGVRILIDGPLGRFDVSLGSNLPAEVRDALSNGQPVQVTGVVQSTNGKDYLIARQLNVAGHQVKIRNSNGFLARNPSTDGSATGNARSQGNGGVR